MSNDLISRSALMSHIESQYREWGENYDAEQILGDIEDFKTAYDVDKIVERLEELANNARELMNYVKKVNNPQNYPCEYNLADIEETRYKTLCESIISVKEDGEVLLEESED